MSRDEPNVEHNDAFGLIGYSHIQGQTDLFEVDYPQGHFIRLTIKTAKKDHREGYGAYVHDMKDIVSIYMSEVQWAAFVAAPNRGTGVPCTLVQYRDPLTGDFKRPEYKRPEKDAAERMRDKVRGDAEAMIAQLTTTLDRVDEMLAGSSVKKGDLQTVRQELMMNRQALKDNLPFLVERIDDTINTAKQNAQAEVDAHIDYALGRLGQRALGDRLTEALEAGTDVRAIGRAVAGALSGPAEVGS